MLILYGKLKEKMLPFPILLVIENVPFMFFDNLRCDVQARLINYRIDFFYPASLSGRA